MKSGLELRTILAPRIDAAALSERVRVQISGHSTCVAEINRIEKKNEGGREGKRRY